MSHYSGSVPDTQRADDWRNTAACSAPQYNGHTELWFAHTTDHDAIDAAKRVCRSCPVIQTCGDYALTQRIADGVWGGMSEAERRNLLRQRGRGKGRAPKAEPEAGRMAAECGTTKVSV